MLQLLQRHRTAREGREARVGAIHDRIPSHPSEHRHEYVIKSLGRLRGLLKPHRYVYLCLRCKWTFVVNDGRRGVISAVDHDLSPLPTHEATRRLESFGAGPCPTLAVLHHSPEHADYPSPRLALAERADRRVGLRMRLL